MQLVKLAPLTFIKIRRSIDIRYTINCFNFFCFPAFPMSSFKIFFLVPQHFAHNQKTTTENNFEMPCLVAPSFRLQVFELLVDNDCLR